MSELEPHIVGPYSPDLSRKISEMPVAIKENNYQDNLRVGLIGSCTNSSYEDIERAAHIAKQALEKGLKAKSSFYITPGSNQIKQQWSAMDIQKIFRELGGENACKCLWSMYRAMAKIRC